ncbi:MAG: hypothetical protein H7Y59_05040 [Anaerolineales bacterium]|nr:hypothetical protein [Anaerolineales bacterium]
MIISAKQIIPACLLALTSCQMQTQQIEILPTPQTYYASPSENNNNASTQTYYVSPMGNDTNSGTLVNPWRTIKNATANAIANSLIIVREGIYSDGNEFANHGVTIKNYPGEQVVIRLITGDGYRAFDCYTDRARTDIHIIGSDVTPKILSNGVVSQKGIVIQGEVGTKWAGFVPHGGCDRWEIAGIDFVDVGHGIFQLKETYSKTGNLSADNWYVHDNRVYGYYRETGMQFNGNENIVENNEIVKATPRLETPYGCYLINLLGHGNIVRNNILTGTGGTECNGILFEWSQSDANLIEDNIITGVPTGIRFQGGDNNIIKNNTIIGVNPAASGYNGMDRAGIEIFSYYDAENNWPCDDYLDSPSFDGATIPPNDSSHIDFPYYYPHGECESFGNQIIGNTISGFTNGVMIVNGPPTIGTTVIIDNIITGWARAKVCNYSQTGCSPLPSNVYWDDGTN